MHPALQIEEILLNIFGHRHKRGHVLVPRMAILARTCRAFKEPALDVLWGELTCLSPLAQCLPDASYHLPQKKGEEHFAKVYSFHRSPTQTEWDILRSYTRRIRSIVSFDFGIDVNGLIILSNPPTSEPLFPALRRLYYHYKTQPIHLLHLPFPSLASLELHFKDTDEFQDILRPLPELSPNIRSISLELDQLEADAVYNRFFCDWICQWRNLESVICPEITADMQTFLHISRIPTLSQLDIVLTPSLLSPDTLLFFPNLRKLELHSASLAPISQIISQARLPAITDLTAIIDTHPTQDQFRSFLNGVLSSSAGHNIRDLTLNQDSHSTDVLDRICLSMDTIRPIMSFGNLRHLELDIEWDVFLTNDELLSLSTALPHLEELLINERWGWSEESCGITPNGLLKLMQNCRSLRSIALCWYTQGYTEVPSSGLLERHGLTLPRSLYLNVLDSTIEAESVPALTAFFSDTFAKCLYFYYSTWDGEGMVLFEGWEGYRDRWGQVYPEPDDEMYRLRLAYGPPEEMGFSFSSVSGDYSSEEDSQDDSEDGEEPKHREDMQE